MTALLERLGRDPGDRLVIITVDGLGASNAGNEAIREALDPAAPRDPLVFSASLQVPCPWAPAGALIAVTNAWAVGVELTLNCAPEGYRWGSITHAPSLNDGSGSLPSTVNDVLDHADTPEVLRECRAQIGRSRHWGIDPAFLSSHLDAMVSRPEFFDVLMELANEFALPVRLPDPGVDLGYDARGLAASEGVLTPDRVIQAPAGQGVRDAATAALDDLEPGVTEIVSRPAIDTPELRAMTPHWAARVDDSHLVTRDWGFRAMLQRAGAELIGWDSLCVAQRRVDA